MLTHHFKINSGYWNQRAFVRCIGEFHMKSLSVSFQKHDQSTVERQRSKKWNFKQT